MLSKQLGLVAQAVRETNTWIITPVCPVPSSRPVSDTRSSLSPSPSFAPLPSTPILKDAEKALKNEAKIQSVSQMALVPHLGADASIADHILYFNEADCDPNSLVQGYRLLRDWVLNSLDLYKVKPPSPGDDTSHNGAHPI
jgi:hypothetical protein